MTATKKRLNLDSILISNLVIEYLNAFYVHMVIFHFNKKMANVLLIKKIRAIRGQGEGSTKKL